MTFGDVPVHQALGSILAHSLSVDGGVLKKGTVLDEAHLVSLENAGHSSVVAAQLEEGDIGEDEAAERIGQALVSSGLRLGTAFTGRVNLIAEHAGVVRVHGDQIQALNRIHEGLTLATLPDLLRVDADQLIVTVKVIPYGLAERVVDEGVAALSGEPLRLHPFFGGRAQLVMTRTPGFKESLLTKGEAIVRERLSVLSYDLVNVTTVPHETDAVAAAFQPDVDLILVLGASATSDRADVAPAALVQAGGQIDRFGMPVDPGNLLFLGSLSGTPVVGLPGCARSPALNGVDWVLERLSARIPVTSEDVAAMGVGGLLKEMAGRPQPRRPRS